MARMNPPEIRERDVGGVKMLQKLLPLWNRLHDVGGERDKAGHRKLHFDQCCLLVLLQLFNPIVNALRSLQQASELNKVQSAGLPTGRAGIAVRGRSRCRRRSGYP